MITKRPGPPGKVRVTFAMPATVWADSIYVVGDFNNWDQRATPLRQTETGWMVTLELDGGRAYQYRYLMNGDDWYNDWQADGYALNEYGGDNSVVMTPLFDDDGPSAEPAERERVITLAPRLRLVTAS